MMLSGSSGVGSGLGSQPCCSAQQPPPRNLLLPPRSCSLSLPTQEDFFQSFNGGCCDGSNALGAELVDCNYSSPDPQLVRRIVAQVEFYLSDENLAKDAFLLKHVQKNKMGFVSIKLLTSFKKVKYLTRDWRLTLYALRFSALLEVNEEGTKVRRRVPVPESLLNIPPSKLLLAWELLPQEQEVLLLSPPAPFQKNFLETVTRMFSPFGAISSIRILRPGRKLPSDVRRYAARFPELLSKCCALVEYESLESARRAFEDLGHQSHPGGESIRVVRLCGKCPKKKPGAERETEQPVDQAAWKAQAAPRFSCSLRGSLLPSSLEKDGPLGSPPHLPQKEPPVWPSSDQPGAFSEAFTGLLLTSEIFPPLEAKVGTRSCSGLSCSTRSCSGLSCSTRSCSSFSCSTRSCSSFSCSTRSCSSFSCSTRSCSGLSCSTRSCSSFSCSTRSCSGLCCSARSPRGAWGSRAWVPWGSSPCPDAEAPPGDALMAKQAPEPLSPQDQGLHLPDGTRGFCSSSGRGELILRR